MKLYNYMAFMICLDTAASLMLASGLFVGGSLGLTNFSRTIWDSIGNGDMNVMIAGLAGTAIGTGIIGGLLAIYFKQGTYAIGALVIWALVSFAPLIVKFVNAVPEVLDTVIVIPEGDLAAATFKTALKLCIQVLFGLSIFITVIEFAASRNVSGSAQ
jgi:hypothetical protein